MLGAIVSCQKENLEKDEILNSASRIENPIQFNYQSFLSPNQTMLLHENTDRRQREDTPRSSYYMITSDLLIDNENKKCNIYLLPINKTSKTLERLVKLGDVDKILKSFSGLYEIEDYYTKEMLFSASVLNGKQILNDGTNKVSNCETYQEIVYNYIDWYIITPSGWMYDGIQLIRIDVFDKLICYNSGGSFPNPIYKYNYNDTPRPEAIEEFVDNIADFSIDPNDEKINDCEIALVLDYPFKAFKINDNKSIAYAKTEEIFGLNGFQDCSDAFRHAFFNAINSKSVGTAIAKEFGDAHECPKVNESTMEIRDHQMDLWNNSVGYKVYKSCPSCTNEQLAVKILQELRNGAMLVFDDTILVNSKSRCSYL